MASILLVEDQDYLRKSIAMLLGMSGHHITAVEDGIEGLATFIPDEHQLVLTDIQMPRMDGIELGKIISEQYPQTPIIYSSANPGYAQKIKLRGNDAFAAKPYTPDYINTLIDRMCK